MKATENQEQIAKEICLKMIEANMYMVQSSRKSEQSNAEFNAQVGEEIGSLYKSILSKIAETENI